MLKEKYSPGLSPYPRPGEYLGMQKQPNSIYPACTNSPKRSAPMCEKTVLLIESGQFIGGVIRSLFTNSDALNVIEAAPSNSRELIRIVNRARPQIVVLDDTVRADYLAHLLRYMRNSEGIRVIVVNTNSNQVEVYEKQQIPVKQTADFLAIL